MSRFGWFVVVVGASLVLMVAGQGLLHFSKDCYDRLKVRRAARRQR